jgi:hypothetical protein
MVGCSLLASDPEVFGTYVVPSIFKVSLLKDEVKVEVEIEITKQVKVEVPVQVKVEEVDAMTSSLALHDGGARRVPKVIV